MRKFILWVSGVMLVSLGAGFLLLNILGGLKLEKQQVSQAKQFSASGIKKINLTTTKADIIVTSTAAPQIAATLKGETVKGQKVEITSNLDKNVGTLKIHSANAPRNHTVETMSHLELNVVIPDSYRGDISIATLSGKISVSNLTLANLKIDSSSDAEITDVAGNLQIKASDISLSLKELAGNIKIDNSNDATLTLPKTASYVLSYYLSYHQDPADNSDNFRNNSGQTFTKTDNHYTGKVADGKYSLNVADISGAFELDNQ